jgi:hypothetical protein
MSNYIIKVENLSKSYLLHPPILLARGDFRVVSDDLAPAGLIHGVSDSNDRAGE